MNKTKKKLKIEAPLLPKNLPELTLNGIQTDHFSEIGMIHDSFIDNITAIHVSFENRFANLKQVIIEGCSLQNADLYRTTLQKVYLQCSNIDKAQLSGTKLEGIDLSDCEFYICESLRFNS